MAFPTLAVTPGTGQTINTLPNAGQATMVESLPVAIASNQSALSVTGTFWQATQPISGSVSVGNFPATQPVSGTFWQVTQPVSIASMPSTPVTGTFWQATQPVSGSVSVSNFPATQPVSGTFWQATQPVSIATMPSTPVTGTFWQATQPVKAVKDTSRTAVILNASGIATVASAALVTMQKYVAGTVTTGVTEYIVTTGKTLAVQSIVITFRPTTPSTTVTFVSCTWSLRRGTATLTTSSSLVATGTGMVTTNTPSIVVDFDIPDCLEFAAADHIGFTHVGSGTTGTFDLTLIGFEY